MFLVRTEERERPFDLQMSLKDVINYFCQNNLICVPQFPQLASKEYLATFDFIESYCWVVLLAQLDNCAINERILNEFSISKKSDIQRNHLRHLCRYNLVAENHIFILTEKQLFSHYLTQAA